LTVHDEAIGRRHAIGDGRPMHIDEAQVAFGQQSEQPTLIVDDHERADP
jgi:hypothetical protein